MKNELQLSNYMTPIEIALGIDDKGMTTARKLYDFLEMNKAAFARWAKTNIECNEFYEENKDWWGFNIMLNGNECKDYKLTTDFAKHLSMESHSDKGKEARNYFVKVEDTLKESVVQIKNLSPELQMFQHLFNGLAKQEIELKKISEQSEEVLHKVESIRDLVSLDTISWREDTGNILRKIAVALGGGQAFSQIRTESYELLNKRMGVDLKTRITNKRRRMADNGICKSARDKLSAVDIIADDKKLIEGYTAIVKEMAIKYGVA